MATKQGFNLSGKLGKEIHYTVNGVERVRTGPEHVIQPGTDIQKAHWDSFTAIVRLSSRMSDAAKIGLAYPARRHNTYTYLHFRSINSKCFTPEGDIDYPGIILSTGTVACVEITSVEIHTLGDSDVPSVTVSFDPCLQDDNANPDDEFYLFAYCPERRKGQLSKPVPRIARTHTLALPAEWFDTLSADHAAPFHLYAFLRCPGPTKDTPETARPSAKNRRGQTSPTIYIPTP